MLSVNCSISLDHSTIEGNNCPSTGANVVAQTGATYYLNSTIIRNHQYTVTLYFEFGVTLAGIQLSEFEYVFLSVFDLWKWCRFWMYVWL
jgi:hypothetical protein